VADEETRGARRLKDFVGANHDLISVIGVFTALTLFSATVGSTILGPLISAAFLTLTLLLFYELIGQLPSGGTLKLKLFKGLMPWIAPYLLFYWLVTVDSIANGTLTVLCLWALFIAGTMAILPKDVAEGRIGRLPAPLGRPAMVILVSALTFVAAGLAAIPTRAFIKSLRSSSVLQTRLADNSLPHALPPGATPPNGPLAAERDSISGVDTVQAPPPRSSKGSASMRATQRQPLPSGWERLWPLLLGGVLTALGGFVAQWGRASIDEHKRRQQFESLLMIELEAIVPLLRDAAKSFRETRAVPMLEMLQIDQAREGYDRQRQDIVLIKGPVLQHRIEAWHRALWLTRHSVGRAQAGVEAYREHVGGQLEPEMDQGVIDSSVASWEQLAIAGEGLLNQLHGVRPPGGG
jgi:hypothetical protein